MPVIASIALKPNDRALGQAHDWLQQASIEHHWPVRTTFALKLCMDEALTNSVQYGFTAGVDKASKITLILSLNDPFIILEIIDNGIPFDPTQKEPNDLAMTLEDATPGGHGIRLMRHYLHDIRYTFTDGQNRLSLIINNRCPDEGRPL